MTQTDAGQSHDTVLALGLLEANLSRDIAAMVAVLDLFADQASEQLGRMDLSLTSEAWRALFHSLRGAALTVGAEDLASACSAAEAEAGSGASPRQAVMRQVQDAASQALAAVADYLARNRSQTENS